MEDSITCQIYSDFKDIEGLENDWKALQARAGVCLFTGYDWLIGWWQTIGQQKDRSLHIVTAKRGNELVGLLPLMVQKKLGIRVLEWAGNEIFDYCNALASDPAVVAELWQAAQKSPYYDFGLIRDVRATSSDVEFLADNANKLEHAKAPFIRLEWASGEAWLKSRVKKQRRDINYKTQRLEQRGPIKLEVLRQGPVEPDVIDRMIRNKALWCLEHKKKGVFSNPLIIPAFRRMAAIASKQKALFLATLKCGDVPVSHVFGFINRKTLYCYFTCYDPDWAMYSPGTLIFAHTIQWAIDNGFKEYDFMRGVESFKLRYASDVRDLPTFVFGRTLAGRISTLVYRFGFYGNAQAKAFAKRLPVWMQKQLLSLRSLTARRAPDAEC